MTEPDIQKLIENAEDFPRLSKVPSVMVRLASEPAVPVRQAALMLQKEPALQEKILTIINSGFYRLTASVTRIDQAISLLGYQKICSLAASLSLLDLFPVVPGNEFDHGIFWERSILHAVAAGEISAHLKGELSADAFTVGLIQDVGSLVLSRCCPLAYGKAVGFAQGKQIHVAHAEQEILGLDHAAVGALLCKHWNLPDILCDIVRNHHFSEFGGSIPLALKSSIQAANLSNLLADALYEENTQHRREVLYQRAEDFFRFKPVFIDELLNRLPERLGVTCESLGVSPPSKAEPEHAEQFRYYEICPYCGSKEGLKFCGECGASLEITTESPPLSTSKVLIAEDSAATRLAISILARKLGYTPLEAFNGLEALKIARRERPGLIIMDITMPGMDGLEALRKIRQDTSIAHVPVVILTSMTNTETVIKALQSGANDYVVKPFSAATIQARIRKYMAE